MLHKGHVTLLNIPGIAIGLKLRPSWWCWWAFCSEGTITSLQVLGLIVEIEH